MSLYEDGVRRHKRFSELSRGIRIGIIAGLALVFVPAFLALFAAVTMWLWNWIMPAIFKLPVIGFWQAVGIIILSHILFKGGYFRRAMGSRWKKERIRARMEEEGPEARAE